MVRTARIGNGIAEALAQGLSSHGHIGSLFRRGFLICGMAKHALNAATDIFISLTGNNN